MQNNMIAKHFKSALHNLPQVFIQDGERYTNAWVSSPQRPPGVLEASVCCHYRRPAGACRPPQTTITDRIELQHRHASEDGGGKQSGPSHEGKEQ